MRVGCLGIAMLAVLIATVAGFLVGWRDQPEGYVLRVDSPSPYTIDWPGEAPAEDFAAVDPEKGYRDHRVPENVVQPNSGEVDTISIRRTDELRVDREGEVRGGTMDAVLFVDGEYASCGAHEFELLLGYDPTMDDGEQAWSCGLHRLF